MAAAAECDDPSPKISVLVVEDEILIRWSLCDLLRESGFHVFEAKDAREANHVLSLNPAVALVFSDVRMANETDGLDFIRSVKRDHPEIKTLLTSSHLPTSGADLADIFIAKPYRLHDVVERITASLKV